MQLFKATFCGTDPSVTVRDYSGKTLDVCFGESLVIDEKQVEWFKRTRIFTIQEIDMSSLINRVETEAIEGEKQKLRVSQIREPSRRATVLALFPEEKSIVYQRWFFSQLIRLSRSEFSIFATASALPSFIGLNYFGTQHIAWTFNKDLSGHFDFVIGMNQKEVKQMAVKYDAVPIIADFADPLFQFFQPSSRFLHSRRFEAKQGVLILTEKPVTSLQSVLKNGNKNSSVFTPDSSEWLDDKTRSHLLSASQYFINLTQSEIPYYEKEANLCKTLVISVNASQFTNLLVNDVQEAERILSSESWGQLLEVKDMATTEILPLSESNFKGYKEVEKDVDVIDIVIFHRPSLSQKTGADRSVEDLFRHLEKRFQVKLVAVASSAKHSLEGISCLTVEGKDLFENSTFKNIPVAKLYIVSDSLIRPLRAMLPAGSVLVYLHYLGELSRELERAVETFDAALLSGFKVLSPSRWLADELRSHYNLDVEHVPPFYNWKRATKKVKVSSGKFVFIPVLYGTNADIQFVTDLAKAMPDVDFVIGDCRSSALYLHGIKNIKIEYYENIYEALSAAKVVLVFAALGITFSISAWEALAAGVPVLAEDSGALKDLPASIRLPRDVEVWKKRIMEIWRKERHGWGGLKTSCIHAFNNYMKTATKWDECLDSHFSKEAPGFKFETSVFAGIAGAFNAMEYAVGRGEIPMYSILEKPKSGIAYIASTLTQLHIDNQTNILSEAANRLSDKRDLAVVCPDLAVVEFINRLVGKELAFKISLPVRPLRADIKPVRSDRVSVLFRTIASRKNFFFNALLAAKAGVSLIDVDEQTPYDWITLARRIGLTVSRHGFYNWDKYSEFLGSLAAGLQYTMGESFNYTAFEHFLAGVPCLVSEQTRCIFELPESWHWLIIREMELEEATEKLKRACLLPVEERRLLAAAALKAAHRCNQKFKGDIARIMSIVQWRNR